MNSIERGRAFVQMLLALVSRTAWEWRRCPFCGETRTHTHGSYPRHPWVLAGRQDIRVQRHRCLVCRRTYSEQSALLIRGSWYGREVHRLAIDHWQHVGSSLRRTAELLRSVLGRQERWQIWRPLDGPPAAGARCFLSASSVHRWLDGAGKTAQATVAGQLAGVATSGQVGTDGLWARLRGGTTRVVLAVVDSVTGVIWPPVVVATEATGAAWGQLFTRAATAGLDLDARRGVTSDGAQGLIGYLQTGLEWVNQQRWVFHRWRQLAGTLATQASLAAAGLGAHAAAVARTTARRELVALIHGVLDATSEAAAQLALAKLAAHAVGGPLAALLADTWDAALVYRMHSNRGVQRVGPEWYWRDFRLRLSRGRNHGSDARLERAALLWALARNLTPAQWRSERKRHYRYPGKSPLEVAGHPPGPISYLDALHV